jgi:hypothetical protein
MAINDEAVLLSNLAKVEGGDGHDSGSGLSAAVEHPGTTAGVRQEQNQQIIRGEKGSVGMLAHRQGGVPVRCSGDVRGSEAWHYVVLLGGWHCTACRCIVAVWRATVAGCGGATPWQPT